MFTPVLVFIRKIKKCCYEKLNNIILPRRSCSKSRLGFRFGYDLTSCNSSLSCVNKSAPAIPCDKGYYYDKSIFTATVITEVGFAARVPYL